ncbi:MAG: hypothetical protein WCX61_01515 [Candidatus Peribacteraceae bacterium]|jgi:hypothetical protein
METPSSSVPGLFAFNEHVAFQLDASPGWRRGYADSLIIGQPKLGVAVRWVYWKAPDGKFLYDQILRAEKPGAVFLPVADGKIGLIQQYRPQARDMGLYEKEFPDFSLDNIGRVSWEAPRGFRIPNTSVEETACAEVEAETGGCMVRQHALYPCCDNTAFSPHLTYLSFGEIDLSRRGCHPADPLEVILGKLQFFSLEQVKQMQADGTCYCAYTATCIAQILLHHPGLLQ